MGKKNDNTLVKNASFLMIAALISKIIGMLYKLINRESNILLLDEPTNHLDVDAKEELKRALMTYKGSVLMVCHEPDFYEEWATDIWDVSKWTTKIDM